MRVRRPAAASVFLVCAASWAACDTSRSSSSPLLPTGSVELIRLELEGPSTVAPGAAVQFTVFADRANGTRTDVTDEVVWFSSHPDILSIHESGRAIAHALGDTTLTASFRNQWSVREIIVVPNGTYRLSGIVSEAGVADGALGDVRVAVTAGIGAGAVGTTDTQGRYRFYGVAGDVRLQATRSGYAPAVHDLTVGTHLVHHLDMHLLRPREDVSGAYTLRVTAAESCRQRLPPSARARSYGAAVAQDGPRLAVALSGSTFAPSAGGPGNRFHGRVDPDGITFVLTSYVPQYYGFRQYPDVIETIPDVGHLVIDGRANVTSTSVGLQGTLSGAFQTFHSDPVWGAQVREECRGVHQFEFHR